MRLVMMMALVLPPTITSVHNGTPSIRLDILMEQKLNNSICTHFISKPRQTWENTEASTEPTNCILFLQLFSFSLNFFRSRFWWRENETIRILCEIIIFWHFAKLHLCIAFSNFLIFLIFLIWNWNQFELAISPQRNGGETTRCVQHNNFWRFVASNGDCVWSTILCLSFPFSSKSRPIFSCNNSKYFISSFRCRVFGIEWRRTSTPHRIAPANK